MRKTVLLVLVVVLVGLWMMPGRASSHREAPLISGDPQVDNTDLWAFMSPADSSKVALISSWIPFEDPAGGPNFYAFDPSALYEIKVDNNGDAREDITFQFRFTNGIRNPNTFLYGTGPITALDDPDRNLFQTYTVTRVDGPPGAQRTVFTAGPFLTMYDNIGATTPNYGGHGSGVSEFTTAEGTWRVFAGQSDDGFFLDLRVFDLLYGGNLSEVGNDTLAGFNNHSIALEAPKNALRAGNPIIGVWSTASRPATTTRAPGGETHSGAFVQVSRLANPLVNEVVIALRDKDRWNGSQPSGDAQFLNYVTTPEVPVLVELLYGIPRPPTPRNDLVAVFLTGVAGLNQPPGVTPSEMMRLNTDILPSSSENRLGVIGGDIAGYPNGRRMGDDVLDITLQVAEGELVGSPNDLGDGVNANDVPFRNAFPYVAAPHSGGAATRLR